MRESQGRTLGEIARLLLMFAVGMALPIYLIVYGRLLVANGTVEERMADLLRDVTTYGVVWVLMAVWLIGRVRGWVDGPLTMLSRVLGPLAGGDMDIASDMRLPSSFGLIADAVKAGAQRSAERYDATCDKVVELGNLVRVLTTLPCDALMVVDRECVIQYANEGAASLFQEADALEGCELQEVSGGAELALLAEAVFAQSERPNFEQREVAMGDGRFRCAHGRAVFDPSGAMTRLVLLLTDKSV